MPPDNRKVPNIESIGKLSVTPHKKIFQILWNKL